MTTSWSGEELWDLFRIVAMVLTGISTIVAFRRRPNAPPNSPMVRWSVAGVLAAATALIALLFWLATRKR